MTYELIIIAGDEAQARPSRRARLERAARSVPGYSGLRCADSPTAIAGVVETRHQGGTVAEVAHTARGDRLTIALTSLGLSAACEGGVFGGEGAHASVLLEDDGGLVISTDGLALIPIYWWADGRTLLASTHLATLVSLGVPAIADERAVVEYLTFHHPLGTRTLLRDCQVLPAGACLRWSEGQCAVAHRPPLFELSRPVLHTDSEALSEFADVWPAILADTFADGGRVGVSLSGGMDSRTIAGTVAAEGLRAVTFTYGDSRSAEVNAAARVAEMLRLPHLSLPVSDRHVLANADEILAHLDGAHSPNEMYDAWFSDSLRDSVDTVINGHGGDPQWGNSKGIGLKDPGAVREKLWSRYRSQALFASRFLAGSLGDAAESLARESLTASLEPWNFGCRSDMSVAWAMENRQRRWGNMLITALRRAGLRPQAPFLDRRFLMLSSRFSPEQRLHGSLYLRLHAEMFPATAAVPRSDDGNAPRHLNHIYWSSESSRLSQLVRLAVRHPVSGFRRGAGHGVDVVTAGLRDHAGLEGPADRRAARKGVFALDSWLRTRPVYVQRLKESFGLDAHPLISDSAVHAALTSIDDGRPLVSAAALGRLAALKGWLADYEARAEAYLRESAGALA